MINDISHYDARRNRRWGMRDVRREANGRPSRTPAPEFMVYFVRIQRSPFIKVGRTKSIKVRIASYEQASGLQAHCLAQLIVGSSAEAVALENHVLGILHKRYPRNRREWIAMPDEDLPGVLRAIKAAAPVTIIEQRGAPGEEQADVPLTTIVSHETMSALRAYRSKRSARA